MIARSPTFTILAVLLLWELPSNTTVRIDGVPMASMIRVDSNPQRRSTLVAVKEVRELQPLTVDEILNEEVIGTG
jgi:hypothetical protein